MVRDGDTIAVWFSCGAASAVAAKLTVDAYRDRCKVHILNSPIAEEDEDNRRFLGDVEKWIGVEIGIVRSKKYPSCSAVDLWTRAHICWRQSREHHARRTHGCVGRKHRLAQTKNTTTTRKFGLHRRT